MIQRTDPRIDAVAAVGRALYGARFQTLLAREMGVSRPLLTHVLNGRRNPSDGFFQKFNEFLRVQESRIRKEMEEELRRRLAVIRGAAQMTSTGDHVSRVP